MQIKNYKIMKTSYNPNNFNFSEYLREHPLKTWDITKTLNSPKVIEKTISPKILYYHIRFNNFRVFNPENCMDFLVEVLRQFPKNWEIQEVHFIEEDTTDIPLKRSYPDLYTIYKVDTGNTEPVNLDFLKIFHNGEANIFYYYDCNFFLNIVTIQKA